MGFNAYQVIFLGNWNVFYESYIIKAENTQVHMIVESDKLIFESRKVEQCL